MARTTIRTEDITAGQIKSADLETNVVIDGDLTVDTDTLHVDSTNNRVGIGTTTPAESLNLVGTSGDVKIRFDGDSSNLQNNYIGITSYDDLVIAADESNTGTASTIQFRVDNSERMRIDSSGNLLVGTTSTGAERVVCGVTSGVVNGYGARASTSAGGVALVCRNSSNSAVGTVSFTNSSTSYNTSSDYRLKENIVALDNGIDRLKQIPVHRFNFIVNPDTTVDGFLAHEVQDVVPEAITGAKDAVDAEGNPEYQGIDQSKLVPLLTAALQEAVAKIESLEARVAVLESN